MGIRGRVAEQLHAEQGYNEDFEKTQKEVQEAFEENFKKIEGTPFTTAKVQDKYYVLLGMSRLSEGHDTEEEAIESGKEVTWDKILSVIVIAYNKLNK